MLTSAPSIHNPSESYIFFELAGTTYGLPASIVQQMEMVESITPVPNALPFVEGVVFSRGQVIPVINLRLRFGFPKIPNTLRTRLIVIHTHDRTLGLLVDTAREFVTLPSAAIQPPPEGLSELSGKYLAGIATLGERTILLLDPEELIAHSDTALPSRADS